jgi:hypothetical protein
MGVKLQSVVMTLLLGLILLADRAFALPSACGKYYTVMSGDTCASIAAASGISVSEFLRNNPNVVQCDVLTAGNRFCVDPSSSSDPPLKTSADGQCGSQSGYTCTGSSFGSCCSEHGWYVEPTSLLWFVHDGVA